MRERDFYAQAASGMRIATDLQTFSDTNRVEGGFHTARDWGLYWTDFDLTAPEVETKYVTVPGRHGVLDLSEALTGSVVYHNRTLSASFAVPCTMPNWHQRYSDIVSAIHGKNVSIVLDTDPDYYYHGRCTVSSVRETALHSTFSITADVAPYKYSCRMFTLEDWLWDPFDFVSGVIPDAYGKIYIEDTGTLAIRLSGVPPYALPTFRVSADCTVEYRAETYTLRAGEDNRPLVFMDTDSPTMTFTGAPGTSIEIAYHGGIL